MPSDGVDADHGTRPVRQQLYDSLAPVPRVLQPRRRDVVCVVRRVYRCQHRHATNVGLAGRARSSDPAKALCSRRHGASVPARRRPLPYPGAEAKPRKGLERANGRSTRCSAALGLRVSLAPRQVGAPGKPGGAAQALDNSTCQPSLKPSRAGVA